MSMVWRIKKLIQDYRYKKVDIGDNSRINLGVQISNLQNMKIGDNGNGGGIKRLVSNRDLRCVYVGQISASAHTSIVRKIFRLVRHVMAVNRCAEISFQNIGAGFHLSHGNAIILTAKARIGEKCSLRNGITIGVEMCGKRKGVPTKK